MQKKVGIISVTLIVIIAVCIIGYVSLQKQQQSANPYEYAVDNSQKLLEAVLNKDAEAIASLFCSHVRKEDPELEKKIQDWLAYIEGDIISYEEPTGNVGGGRSTAKDGVVELSVGGGSDNITTSTGKVYSIGYGGYFVYDEHPEYVGITDIIIFDEQLYTKENGYPEEGKYEIYLPEMWE